MCGKKNSDGPTEQTETSEEEEPLDVKVFRQEIEKIKFRQTK